MNNKQRAWLLVGPVIFSFMMAMTNTSVTRKGFLEWYDKHFTLIVVTDVLLFTVISFAGME